MAIGRDPPRVRRHHQVPEGSLWLDLILYYEYFHGDNGAGIGASHQTGWTGVVARLEQLLYLYREKVLEAGIQKVAHDPSQLTGIES
jgi:hypothetical protein